MEDLRIYQSSSRDKEFKEEMRLYPERFKLKVVKVFRTNRKYEPGNNFDYNGCIVSKAKKLELKYQRKFQVDVNPKFYNMSMVDFEEGSEWDGVILWDLENNCEFIVENSKEFSKEFRLIWGLVTSNILNGRFCKLDETGLIAI